MEGVVDPVLRDLLTAVGGVDYCVTEFIRVTSHLLPKKIFYEYCPELYSQSKTLSGTPVLVQLLGSNSEMMAENAALAAELGAYGIDLNFGCPAKTVNNHDGGAALLKTPERIFKVIEAVRKSVPAHISVSAKTRLGFDNKDYVTEIAQAAESGGADWLTVHARTKTEGYRPPAHWEYITQMKAAVQIPVVANGEIWTRENFLRCQEVTGCEHFMIGRGLVANPGLALEIKEGSEKRDWKNWWSYWQKFIPASAQFKNETYALQRSKQLAKMMGQAYGESLQVLERIKRLESYADLLTTIAELQSQNLPPTPPTILSAKKIQ
jgi:tRNA-dihydrouridine synthase C